MSCFTPPPEDDDPIPVAPDTEVFNPLAGLPPWIQQLDHTVTLPPVTRPYVTVMDEMRVGLDGEQRVVVLMLVSGTGPPYPMIAFREKQLAELLPMLQHVLRALSQLPLEDYYA